MLPQFTRASRTLGLATALLLCPLAAHASIFQGEALDTAADYLAWFVIIVIPPAAIALFWIVHVLPQKAAEKRQHPQKEAIHVLCLLSLFFGGMLWPFAWLWAYARPTAHAVAHGTEKHEDYFTEQAERAEKGELSAEEIEGLRHELDSLSARGFMTLQLHEARNRLARIGAAATVRAEGSV
jgi:CBS domain containing-hemolysin-like protein